MLARAMPLAACLLWLACEAHFSPRFFMENVRISVAEIKGGLDFIFHGKNSPNWKMADNDARER